MVRTNYAERAGGLRRRSFVLCARKAIVSHISLRDGRDETSAEQPTGVDHGVRLCNLAHKERSLPKDQFKRGVEKELTGRESEPWGTIYFKLYKTQIPIVEQAVETAALMLGTDKSRGYCLEMICADFLAGANLDNSDPRMLLQSITRFFKFLPGEERQEFLSQAIQKAS